MDWGFGLPTVDARNTMYDLASITKVVATSAAAIVENHRGKLKLDAPVGRYLPEFKRGDKARVTVRDLLTHRSGLPAGRSLARAHGSKSARRLILETPLDAPPGEQTEYSDVGADVLGFVVEAIAGERLDQFVSRTVYRRLGLRNTVFVPSRDRRSRIAPTENYPPRGYPLRGEVHDEMAFALGGVAGHAGLFATAADLAVFAQMMLNGGTYNGVRIVSDTTVARFTERTAGSRALGWDTCIGGGSCGLYMGARAFGHTGYTGTHRHVALDRSRRSDVRDCAQQLGARTTGRARRADRGAGGRSERRRGHRVVVDRRQRRWHAPDAGPSSSGSSDRLEARELRDALGL
jgi:serine-type D-Ala-D-Ala carboxypeptidase